MTFIKPGDTVLFQGDSITAAANGYAPMIAAQLDSVTCMNRAVSGDRVTDLHDRWQRDALDLRPDVISVLVGINDTWHAYVTGAGVPVDRYGEVYRDLLDRTRRDLPAVRLILCEPFYLRCGDVTASWAPEVDARRAIVEQLAADYGARFVPFHKLFEGAVTAQTPPAYWAADGVHPTPAGHALMAQAWLDIVQQ